MASGPGENTTNAVCCYAALILGDDCGFGFFWFLFFRGQSGGGGQRHFRGGASNRWIVEPPEDSGPFHRHPPATVTFLSQKHTT